MVMSKSVGSRFSKNVAHTAADQQGLMALLEESCADRIG